MGQNFEAVKMQVGTSPVIRFPLARAVVDFEDKVYRRCDQNTCVSYDILFVRPHAESTEVSFAPSAIMRADDDGSRYTETLTIGGTPITSSGTCAFRGGDPEPDGFEQEELRQRS